MIWELTLFHISFFSFLYLIIKFKEYKKSLSIFFIIVITIFYSPVIYYTVLNGSAYRIFTDKDLSNFVLLSSLVFFQFVILIIFKNAFRINQSSTAVASYQGSLLKVYITLLTLFVLGYLALHFKNLPLYQAIRYGIIIDRPDTVGYLPNYFTFSVIANLLLPGFYFIYLNKIKQNNFLKILILLTISTILVAGGNKGLIAYFFIFLWVYEFKLKINLKLIFMFLSLFWIYLILKTGEIMFSLQTIEYSIGSPLRRFFVSQGAGFLARVNIMSEDFNFATMENIKNYVFTVIYGTVGGSSPTYFLGDLIVKYGYFLGLLFHFIILTFLFMLSRMIDIKYKNDLFIKWNFFVTLYLLGMAEISESFIYRAFAIILNVVIIYIFIKTKKVNKSNSKLSLNHF